MARRRKSKVYQQLITVGSVLIVLELAYLFLWPRPKALTVQETIASAIKERNLDSARAEQLRIQMSVLDFQQEKGKLPAKLEELIPKYFDEVPKVPGSGEPFKYVVKDNRFYVGDEAAVMMTSGAKAKESAKGGPVYLSSDSTEPLPASVQKALIESLTEDPAAQQAAFVYDPTGKRDPFQPFDFAPKGPDDSSKTPLERYDLGQLKLTAVLGGHGGEPSATVENAAGKGFIVKKGTKIGTNSGEVVDIKGDRIVVVETAVDFTGQKKTRTIELKLRTKDQEDALR